MGRVQVVWDRCLLGGFFPVILGGDHRAGLREEEIRTKERKAHALIVVFPPPVWGWDGESFLGVTTYSGSQARRKVKEGT